MLIDVASLVALGLVQDDEISALETLPTGTLDYGALIPVKNRLLQIAAGRFADVADNELKSRYEAFVGKNDAQWLHE